MKAALSKLHIVLAVVLLGGFAVAEHLIVLHTNDIHGRLEQGEGMGMAKLATLVERYRAEHEHVLLLDAGDTLHGTPLAIATEGASVVEAMNLVGYDVMVPGNHDFNYGGFRRLLELREVAEFEFLAANILRGGEPLFESHVIVEVGPYRVGIFGLVSPAYTSIVNRLFIRGLEITDMSEAAERMVTLLQEEGVDLIVAVGHVGLYGDFPSTRVLDEVEGIDLFVDGHSHDRLEEGVRHGTTLLVQAHEHLKELGVVEVDLSGPSPSLVAALVSAEEAADLPDHPEVRQLLERARRSWTGGPD
jgi:5'-nucleotidase / UDP-sugar diphosphatase